MQDIEKFIRGFQQFQQKYFLEQQELFDELKQGQHPKTLLIGCCDSRVDPALITGSDPGDMFVIRNIANLVPPFQIGSTPQGISSALEFAINSLNVERVIVLGHQHCGGIRALMQGTSPQSSPSGFVERWMQIAESARERVLRDLPDHPPAAQLRAAELASILVSLQNLMTFPWIAERVEQSRLSLHGWYFDIDAGALLAYSPRRAEFLPLICPLDNPQAPR